MDYSASTTSPTVTEIGTDSGDDANEVYVYDIFMISTDVFVIGRTEQSGTPMFFVDEVDTAPFSEKDTWTGADFGGGDIWYGVVSGTTYLTMGEFVSGGAQINYVNYEHSTTTLTVDTGTELSNHSNPARSQMGIAYDGSNIIYFIANKDADSLDYLVSYSISGVSFITKEEFNLALMIDRNTDSDADTPNNLEKAFHMSDDKIYQVPSTYTGKLNWISNFDFSDTIIAITDHFVIDDSLNVYEYTDLLSHFTEFKFTHSKQNFPEATLRFDSNYITITAGMFIQLIGEYTHDGSTNSTKVVFEGIAEHPTLGVMQYCVVKNQGSEMVYVEPSGEYTDDTDGVISDILADTTIGRSYLREGTLADGADLGTINLKGNKKLQKVFDEFATFDGYTWYQNPTGEIDYNAGNVDSGADIRYDGSGNLDTILDMNAWYISGVNKVIVIGAMDTANGVRYLGSWDDEEDQQLNDITLLVVWNTALNTDAKCTSHATAIGTQEGSTRTRAEFKFRKTTYGLIQAGQTITLKYDVTGYMTISEAQYIVDGITIDAISEVGWIRASSGLIFKFGVASEELPEQNSALIEQMNENISTAIDGDVNYATTQHNREIYPLFIIPKDGVVSGDDNVYFYTSSIAHGKDSLDNDSQCWLSFKLPSDYVAGQNLTFSVWWLETTGSITAEYDVIFYYASDGASYAQANNPTGTWTSPAGASAYNNETLTVTGTNLSAGDIIRIRLRMQDQANTVVLYLMGCSLIVPVNTRT